MSYTKANGSRASMRLSIQGYKVQETFRTKDIDMTNAWSYDTEYSVYRLLHQVAPQDAPILTAGTKTAKWAGSWIACSAQSPPQGSPIATMQSFLTASLATLAGTDAQSSQTV